ncbi:MAG: SHD1 domain-containing protein, partial [Pirellulaceae bacterium]
MAALRFCVCLFLILGLGSSIDAQTEQREWTGAHGHYTFNGRMLASSDSQVVVEQDDGQLVKVALSDLSEDDQAYVKSKEAQDAMNASDDGMRPWNMKSGLKVNARVVDFAQREV